MLMGKIRTVKQLCREVATLAHEMEHQEREPKAPLHSDQQNIRGPNLVQSSLRRRSLDLTRALAEMRKWGAF